MSRHIFGAPMLLSLATSHLLGHNDQNEVKHDSVHVMLLAPLLVSHVANGIQNDILFLRSELLK